MTKSFRTILLTIVLYGLGANTALAVDYLDKRVMYVGSYHQEYNWNVGITTGINEVLKDTGVSMKTHYMDTKRNRSETFIREAAVQARDAIEEFDPDIVIICDDNAVKHVLQGFYKDAELPFVFCGVNGDSNIYSLPYQNTAGMIEVDFIKLLLRQLRPYANGERIGFLALDSTSAIKNLEWHQQSEGFEYDKVYLVNNFEDWKEKYLTLQNEVDLIIIGQQFGIKEWDNNEAVAFVRQHTRVPSGALAPGRMDISLLGFLRSSEEQGRWAATTALNILDGAAPNTIPLARNQKAHVVINHALSQKLNIIFPAALFKRAEIFWPYQGRKILFISSYHYEVDWARIIHDSFRKSLDNTGIELRTFIMGAKQNRKVSYLKEKALQAKQLIESFEPDVVITVDDAAAEYIISEYYRNSKLPFVFVGVNWDASDYQLPTGNVTGMIEVEMIAPLYKQLKHYAEGPKLGWLSESLPTMKKNLAYHKKSFGVEYDKVYMVESFEEWKKAFLALQDEVDMLAIQATHAISDWDQEEAVAFVRENTRIPSGSLTYHTADLTVMGFVRLPEEQAEWATRTALKILDGIPPNEIPLVQNEKARLILNRRLVEKLNLVVDRALYRMAEIIE